PDGLEVLAVNPACVVGPDDFAGSAFGRLCQRFWRGRVPVHFGGGNNFVDVRDGADGLLRAAERGRAGQRHILRGGNRTYREVDGALCGAAGRARFWVRLPGWLGLGLAAVVERWPDRKRRGPVLTAGEVRLGRLFTYFDCTRARSELGYTARPLSESLA